MKGFFDTLPTEATGRGARRSPCATSLPLVTPILAVISLFTLAATFNHFIPAHTILRDGSNHTFPVGPARFLQDRYGARWGPFCAGAIPGALPVIFVFMWLRRSLVSSLASGAVKG